MYNDTLGKIHFWITFIGAYSIFLPLHYLGFLGVPRRYFEMGETTFIPESAQTLNAFVTVVTVIVGVAQILFLYNMARSTIKGKISERNPWKATSLEWQTADFPPSHGNFGKALPVVYRWAYAFGVPGHKEDFIPQNEPPVGASAETGDDGVPGGAAQPAE
jgi:cytochrome c oxidase subunit 1